jgi:multidrug transporter EmrE-like cation transporter
MPENEEPEGPNLPPEKVIGKSAMIKSQNNYLEAKGIIASMCGIFIVGCYLYYYFHLKATGIKLNEIYFIASGIGIAVFSGLLFTFFKNSIIKTVLLFTSIFYSVLELIYIYKWVVLGQPYAYFKIALVAGLIIGIIYFIYDKFSHVPRNNS